MLLSQYESYDSPFAFFITGMVMISMMIMHFHSSKKLAYTATQKAFEKVSDQVVHQLNRYGKESHTFLSMLTTFKSVFRLPIPDKRHPLHKVFSIYLDHNPYLYALYIGQKDGSFYEMINLDVDKSMHRIFHIPKRAHWVVIKILNEDSKRIKYTEFLDRALKQLAPAKREFTDYDPTLRPWFTKAYKSDAMIKTEPYPFSNIPQMGTTYARKTANKKSVIGIDMTLQSLEKLLSKQQLIEGSETFIYKNHGSMMAYYKIGNQKGKLKHTIADYYPSLADISAKERVTLKHKEYYQFKTLLSHSYGFSEYLYIISPVDETLEPYLDQIYHSNTLSLLIFLFLALPLIYLSSRLIVNPILELEAENHKIRERNFSQVKRVPSFIKEIDKLSLSLVNMSAAIQQYEKEQKELMDAIIQLIAGAIDEKSEYTGGHCSRVPVISSMLVEEANKCDQGIFTLFVLKVPKS